MGCKMGLILHLIDLIVVWSLFDDLNAGVRMALEWR